MYIEGRTFHHQALTKILVDSFDNKLEYEQRWDTVFSETTNTCSCEANVMKEKGTFIHDGRFQFHAI